MTLIKKFIFVIICLTGILSQNFSQQLYYPLEFLKAVDNGTRTLNGKPGTNYWTNFSKYQINAKFDVESGIITGNQKVVYFNNSPRSFNHIVFNIYQDVFKKGNIRHTIFDTLDIHNGVEITNVEIQVYPSGKVYKPTVSSQGTKFIVQLKQYMVKGDSLKISMTWKLLLPKKNTNRFGNYFPNTWFVAYWYPQIAVFDDISGWDNIQHTMQEEHYFEFADYDVTLQTTNNQIVWATGTLQNLTDIFNKKISEKYRQSLVSDTIIQIITQPDYKNKVLKNPDNSWHFIAKNVPDFAFATSNFFNWDATSIPVPNNSDKRIGIFAVYHPQSLDYKKIAQLAAQTINYYNDESPAITYPYPFMTVFNGNDGMEFPMMVNDRSCESWSETVFLTTHEIAHTYLPFLTGINQAKYGWMDEGLVMHFPVKLQQQLDPKTNRLINSVFNYSYNAGTETDAPIMQPSYQLTENEYWQTTYFKPQLAFAYLEEMIGSHNFNKSLNQFISQWQNKHPTPYDLFNTFNNVCNINLNWYWNLWFFQVGYPDLGIKSVELKDDAYLIVIEKSGILPTPVFVTIHYTNGETETLHETAEIWKNQNNLHSIILKTNKNPEKIILGNPEIIDVNFKNNTFVLNK